MCDVRPFRGLRYNLQRVPDPSSIITPPYDVISSAERIQYYRKSPYNNIRLEYGEEQPGDSADNNKYTRAAAILDAWLKDEKLLREESPALYIVEHNFSYQDRLRCRLGNLRTLRLLAGYSMNFGAIKDTVDSFRRVLANEPVELEGKFREAG